METSRGCPYKCRFCSRYSHFIEGYGYRSKSPEYILKEIQEISKKFRSVLIVDDNFLFNVKKAYKIFDMLIENGSNIDLLIQGIRTDLPDKELYNKMKKANVKLVGYGIESGNQDVLDFYNKKTSLQNIRKSIKLGSEMGFFTFGSFILGAPLEDKEHIERTIRFACSLPLDFVMFSPLYYQMGSDLWVESVASKKISIDEHSVPADKNRGLSNFSNKELEEFTFKAYKRFYLRPKYFYNQVHRILINKELRSFISGFKMISSLLK